MSGYRQLCHCGHHKDSHYRSESTCLGMLCECKRYRDVDAPPDPPHPPPKKCTFVAEYYDDIDDLIDEDPTPTTERMPVATPFPFP